MYLCQTGRLFFQICFFDIYAVPAYFCQMGSVPSQIHLSLFGSGLALTHSQRLISGPIVIFCSVGGFRRLFVKWGPSRLAARADFLFFLVKWGWRSPGVPLGFPWGFPGASLGCPGPSLGLSWRFPASGRTLHVHLRNHRSADTNAKASDGVVFCQILVFFGNFSFSCVFLSNGVGPPVGRPRNFCQTTPVFNQLVFFGFSPLTGQGGFLSIFVLFWNSAFPAYFCQMGRFFVKFCAF